MKTCAVFLVWLVLIASSLSELWAAGDKPPAGGQGQQQGGGNTPAPAGGGTNTGSDPSGSGGQPQGGPQAPAQPTGTIWDHVPEGGSIRAEADGGWTILDRDLKPVGNVPPGQTAPTPPAPDAPPETPAGDGWSPDQMRGTIWDHVPEGGAIRAEADGTWTILDRNMNPIGTYPPREGTPPVGGEGATGTGTTTPTPPSEPPAPPPPPPLVTPLPGGGVMTSQQNADGSWSHHYRRESPDGDVDYDIKPTDDAYPHEDPRFWRPGQTSPDRIVTRLPNGGTITSTRNPDGTWTHFYRSADGNVSYRMRPSDDLYPHDDPRFQNPNPPPANQPPARNFGDGVGMAPGGSGTLGRDVMHEGLADARGQQGEDPHHHG